MDFHGQRVGTLGRLIANVLQFGQLLTGRSHLFFGTDFNGQLSASLQHSRPVQFEGDDFFGDHLPDDVVVVVGHRGVGVRCRVG